ncbi:MAG: hypothetical protein A2Z16_15330 [Chloroflexi bacterium RBG_16_54_18]|nr:MAG: hypothetical protein A2Z16_15330 [Chloroflexi bacterium RBG_16_54_18]
MKKRVTITDVAHEAGVSKSTVSHVINHTRFVEPETSQKVISAIDLLGYRPSGIARSLVSKRTRTAGLLISDVGNPFYHEVIMGVEDIALANDYSVFLCNTSYDLDRGMKFIQSLIDKSVDGVLFMTSVLSFEMVQEVTKNQIKAVVLDWGNSHINELASTVTIDFKEGINQAVAHLVKLGHSRIAHVSGPLHLWTSQVRKEAFQEALCHQGLDPNEAVIIEGNLRIEGGTMAFGELSRYRQLPTAIIAANDLTALGILWEARNAGLRLPEDLSIIGLDDIDLASKVTPALTTIAIPRFEAGQLAMQIMLNMLGSPSFQVFSQRIPTRLVLRDSTTYASNGILLPDEGGD